MFKVRSTYKQFSHYGAHHFSLAVLTLALVFGASSSYFATSGVALAASTTTCGKVPTSMDWMVNNQAINLLKGAGASTTLLNTAFNNGCSYVIYPNAVGTIGIPTVSYDSYQDIQTAFKTRVLPGKYKALIYDNESWYQTPRQEQLSPATYDQKVAALAHQYGMTFIATPAVDLTSTLNPGLKSTAKYTDFIQDQIAAAAARYADVYEIQSQSAENDLPTFTSFVQAAAQQARQANPNVKVMVGLSTNPSGITVTSAQFNAAYTAAVPYANGYWMNVPGTDSCPSCGVPQPQIGVTLLQSIY